MSSSAINRLLKPLLPVFLASLGLDAAMAIALTQPQLDKASQILCDALAQGQSPEAARDAATAYLIDQVDDPKQLNPSVIRQQIRPVVIKRCPQYARKLKNI